MEKLQPYKSNEDHHDLNEEELETFFKDLDANHDGHVTLEELGKKLEQVHEEIAAEPQKHHLHHPERDVERGNDLRVFLKSLLPGSAERINKDDFLQHVRSWHIPSQSQPSDSEEEAALPFRRRLRARWSVEGPKIVFVTLVVAVTLGLSLWQGIKYINSPDIRAAVGWGVIMAKFFAGAIYSTIFLMILSMSRVFATFMRRFYYISRFINWDRSQSFHIWMACAMLAFGSLHAIGHLTGTFRTGSMPDRQPALAVLYGPGTTRTYADYVRSLPGWTGIVSLGLMWILSALSIPQVRRWSYELFQLGHLLMFPIIGLLTAHGTAMILGQYPMLGFWLIIPTLLVVFERSRRVIRGFVKVPARLSVLDDETVVISCTHPRGQQWRYAAGQYILLQVPSVAFWQWHPFTISACNEDTLQVHIKTDGNWTSKLRTLEGDLFVGVDGPYGAPAQRFYDFDKSIIVGSGIGITPFSAIVTDLEQDLSREQDPWIKSRRASRAFNSRSRSRSRPHSRAMSHRSSLADDADHISHVSSHSTVVAPEGDPSAAIKFAEDVDKALLDEKAREGPLDASRRAEACCAHAHNMNTEQPLTKSRRVDFHWMVRDKTHLLWFASLLNRAYDLTESSTARHIGAPLDLNISVHVTAKRKNISTYIFRYLLDAYRTPAAPYSALTGLKPRSNFGRPNFPEILASFHEDMLRDGVKNEKVGVFFCGAPVIGSILADACNELTARSRQDGSKIRYLFMMEVFG